jgi:HlyD family secretion protein
MKSFAHHRVLYVSITIAVIVFIIFMAVRVTNKNNESLVTTTAEVGTVRELVSVSGIAKAEQTASLAFPVSGIVRTVTVTTGDTVMEGDVLVTLDSSALAADRLDALAAINRAVADRDELLNGPTESAREVTSETLAAKEAALATIIKNENQKVSNAYKNLLSSNITAYTADDGEDAPPPDITGTYACEEEGSYRLELFSSGADSGFSYRLTGIESGTFPVATEQTSPLGSCGLQAQFTPDARYSQSIWFIDIPNKKSSAYIANRNAHALAITQAEGAILDAERDVALSKATALDNNAPARTEAVSRASAAITQAQARLNRIDSTISDRTLTAPFNGVITDIDILPGETVTNEPIINLLADSNFEVTARIPEIDVGKLETGQIVEMVFDARPSELVLGTIDFISPQATEIDGVAYYEAIVIFQNIPTWMRSGLNADIEVVVKESTDTIRIPKRFLITTDTGFEVLLLNGQTYASSSVEVSLQGNDGFAAITGLNQGDIIVAP